MITTICKADPQRETAVALGFFDGVHRGHLAVIDRAIQSGGQDKIPAVFTFTTRGGTPTGKQGYTYLSTEQEKHDLLIKAGAKLIVCPDFHEIQSLTPRAFVREILGDQLRARAVCCGEDFRFGKGAAAGIAELRGYGAEMGLEVHTVGAVLYKEQVISSTRIRQAIAQGVMEDATAMLGRVYSFAAPVVKGKQLGRKLGFPTINQPLANGMAVPLAGVYATRVHIDQTVYTGVTNIGTQPTVGGEHPLAETYILDYDGDLYGRTLRIEVAHRLRGVHKFPTVEKLTAEVLKNAQQARDLLG